MNEGESGRAPEPARAIRLSSMLTGLCVACVISWIGIYLVSAVEYCRPRLGAVDCALPWISEVMLGYPLWAWIAAAVGAGCLIVAKDRLLKTEWVAGFNAAILGVLFVSYLVLKHWAMMPVQRVIEMIEDRH